MNIVLALAAVVAARDYAVTINSGPNGEITVPYTCPPPPSSLKFAKDVATNVTLSEPQPNNFYCEIGYKRPQAQGLYSVDVLIVVVGALAELALKDFNAPQNFFKYAQEGMEFRFKKTKEEGLPGYQVKTIMWSLRILTCWLSDNNRWAETSFRSRYGSDSDLGRGQLRSLSSAIDTELEEDPMAQPGNITTTLRERASNDEITVTNFAIGPSAAIFSPFSIYSALISILVAEAELDPGGFTPTVSVYNPVADLSFGMQPTSQAARPDFPNRLVITAIEVFANKFPLIRDRNLQWKECSFLVRNRGRIIGRGELKKGQFTIPPDNVGYNSTKSQF